MYRQMDLPRYTGTRPFAPWHGHGMVPQGHCRHCGQPSAQCCCGCRECRKEAKELVVTPAAGNTGQDTGSSSGTNAAGLAMLRAMQAQALDDTTKATLATSDDNRTAGTGTGFIGGGCCVTLSIEYAPTVATAVSLVGVLVKDADGTTLGWIRTEPAGTGYRIHECIITTKPGATLTVVVLNATARVRWCEVFSCC